MRQLHSFIAAMAVCGALSVADAQTTFAEFNFNAGTSTGDASTGTGTSSGFFFPFTSALPLQTGSPADTNPVMVNGGPNNASGPRSGPNIGEASGLRAATFRTSTAGRRSPSITWDFMQGFRASRYYQMLVTYDGTNFVDLPAGGTGSSINGPFGTASIDATGLIDIRTIDGLIDDAMGGGYMNDLSYSFPEGSQADNNPNFGVQIAAVWEPGGNDFVSSFAGTDGNSDPNSGYIRSTSAGGNQIRYDLVRITGIPEPASAAIAVTALGASLGPPSGSLIGPLALLVRSFASRARAVWRGSVAHRHCTEVTLPRAAGRGVVRSLEMENLTTRMLDALSARSLAALALVFFATQSISAEVTFDWATIGDTNNPSDTLVMTKCPSTFCTGDGTTGYGSVDYEYQIATTHVTATQYAEFLNAVDPAGTNDLGLFDSRMETFFHPVSFLPKAAWSGALTFDAGADAGAKYGTKKGQGNFPATWVSWVSAARFVNWLSNGQQTGDTESGVYDSLPATSNDPIPARAPGATIFLPNDDEFYKAAYYNPTLNAGAGGYTEYGVSDTAPTIEGPTGGSTSANYAQTDGVDGHDGDTYWQSGGAFDDDLTHLTPAGAYSTATSFYGLFDVDGNAYQWLETSRPNQHNASQDLPLFRGGSWFHASDGSGAAYRNTQFFAAGSSACRATITVSGSRG